MENKNGSLKVVNKGQRKHNLTDKQVIQLGRLTKSELIALAEKQK